MNGLRVGCIVDQKRPSHHVEELVAHARRSPHYSICLLVVDDPAPTASARAIPGWRDDRTGTGLRSVLERWVLAGISQVERLLVARLPGDVPQVRPGSSEQPVAIPTLHVRSTRTEDGTGRHYRPDAVRRIQERELDVLIDCVGSSVPVGRILDGARHGLIAVRYGDQAARGFPPGFSEVYTRNPSTRFRIERMGAGGDGGTVLYEGAIYTVPFQVLNAERILRKSAVFLHGLLEFVAREGSLPPAIRPSTAVPGGPPVPGLGDQLAYVIRTIGHFLERASRRLLGVRWRWGVAYQFTDDWQSADLSRSRMIRNRPGRYFADPFVVARDGVAICYVEDYDCRSSRGRISALRLDENGYEELGVVLAEPFHLSYPFVLEAEGQLYMCPETEEARDIRLYRCTGFPLEWSLHRVLIPDVAAVDTSITFHDGRWWMFTNLDSADIGDYRSELHLFHADRFDSQQWQPHPQNPVVFDSQRARNGGLFRSGDGLFRVFQTHGFDVYGQSMGIARVQELSPQRYAEEVITTVRPDFFPGIVGTHSMTFDGGVLAVDFVRRQSCSRK